jgi:soluble lytic murein transglycosylase-like protein
MGVFSRLALLGLLLGPAVAGAGDLYSYVDADGVVHLSNAPADRRFRRVARTSDVAGVYKVSIDGRRSRSRSAARAAPDSSTSSHLRVAAEKYNLPLSLLRAVMEVESNYNPRAISEKGAIGLMQLMPETAKQMYVSDVWDPEQNIDGGARYLRLLANQYSGDMMKTLAAYNAGPEAVRRAGGAVPSIPETREYVRRVLDLFHQYEGRR